MMTDITSDQFDTKTMAIALGDLDAPRPCTELQARAISHMFWAVSQLARKTVGGWAVRNRRPTKPEMIQLMLFLKNAEERAAAMVADPSMSPRVLDGVIASLHHRTEAVESETEQFLAGEVQR